MVKGLLKSKSALILLFRCWTSTMAAQIARLIVTSTAAVLLVKKRHSHTSTLLSEIYFHPSKRCFLCSCSFYQSWAKILKVTVKKINVGQWPKVEVDVSDYYADLQEKIVKATDVNIFSQKSFLKEELTYCPS